VKEGDNENQIISLFLIAFTALSKSLQNKKPDKFFYRNSTFVFFIQLSNVITTLQ